MTTKDIVKAFIRLGEDIKSNINTSEYQNMMIKAYNENPWFTVEHIQTALINFLPWFDEGVLTDICYKYHFAESEILDVGNKRKKILIVAAGNIPAVVFHDIVCVLLSGNIAVVKLSSVDKTVIPFLLRRLIGFLPEIKDCIQIAEGIVDMSQMSLNDKHSAIDGVIATGSNTSSLIFEQYFKHLPHIIRKSRYSLAVITDKNGSLKGLEDDICLFFGLGCRSISHIFVPNGFDIRVLEHLLLKYQSFVNHTKYFNNYTYQKAVMMMNNIPFIDAKPILLRENDELFSPISVVNYSYYEDILQVEGIIKSNADNLQCVVTDNLTLFDAKTIQTFPFGTAQQPKMMDFADNIDTFKWLQTIV